jgi:hypothetical protein
LILSSRSENIFVQHDEYGGNNSKQHTDYWSSLTFCALFSIFPPFFPFPPIEGYINAKNNGISRLPFSVPIKHSVYHMNHTANGSFCHTTHDNGLVLKNEFVSARTRSIQVLYPCF